METRAKTGIDRELQVEVGYKKAKRFKAGAEIGGPVAMHIAVSEQESEQEYNCQVVIRIRD